jgi:hypothetical protein
MRVGPASGNLPRRLALHLVADPNASETIDATVHVNRNARMRVVSTIGLALAAGCAHAVTAEQLVERLIRSLRNRARGVVTSRHRKQASTRRFDIISRGLDHHARHRARRARGHQLALTDNPHQTHSTFAVRLEPRIVAQRRQINSDRTQAVKKRDTIGDVGVGTINRDSHSAHSFPKTHRDRRDPSRR